MFIRPLGEELKLVDINSSQLRVNTISVFVTH